MKRALSAAVIFGIAGLVLPVNSQSIPCSVITQNPAALESLLANHLAAERAQAAKEQVLAGSEVARLRFGPIEVRPGDAFYVEYKGRDFTLFAEHAGGAMTAFDSPPKASPDQWRKGILLFDDRIGSGQRVIRLSAVHSGQEPQFRNLRIIRGGETVFEFAKLTDSSTPRPARVESSVLPCISSDSPQTNAAHQRLPANASYPMAQPVSWFGVPMPSSAPGLLPTSAAPAPAMLAPAYPSSGADANRFKFTGKEFDSESGLYNYGARYYASSSARFLSVDPENAGAALGDPQSWNAYSYARNNPLLFVDPDGLAYRICDMSGRCQSGYGDSDFDKNFGGSSNVILTGDGSGFIIQHVDGRWQVTGTYQHTPDNPGLDAVTRGVLTAGPGITFAGEVLATVGAIANPPAAMAIGCAAGAPSCTKAGVALAMLPGPANKIHHIFGKSKHGLDVVVRAFGSKEAAYNALVKATEATVNAQRLTGQFKVVVAIGGANVTVEGKVVDGAVKIGTAYIP